MDWDNAGLVIFNQLTVSPLEFANISCYVFHLNNVHIVQSKGDLGRHGTTQAYAEYSKRYNVLKSTERQVINMDSFCHINALEFDAF